MSNFKLVRQNETGIYTTKVYDIKGFTRNGKPTPMVHRFSDPCFIGSIKDACEFLRDLLRKHGVKFEPTGRFPEFLSNRFGWTRYACTPDATDDWPDVVFEAAEALSKLDMVLTKYPENEEVQGNVHATMAFEAGQMLERARVRLAEHVALQGRKAASGHAKKAAARKAASDRETAKRKRVWLQTRRENPDAKVTEIDRKTAEQLDVDERTIAGARRAGKWKQEI